METIIFFVANSAGGVEMVFTFRDKESLLIDTKELLWCHRKKTATVFTTEQAFMYLFVGLVCHTAIHYCHVSIGALFRDGERMQHFFIGKYIIIWKKFQLQTAFFSAGLWCIFVFSLVFFICHLIRYFATRCIMGRPAWLSFSLFYWNDNTVFIVMLANSLNTSEKLNGHTVYLLKMLVFALCLWRILTLSEWFHSTDFIASVFIETKREPELLACVFYYLGWSIMNSIKFDAVDAKQNGPDWFRPSWLLIGSFYHLIFFVIG